MVSTICDFIYHVKQNVKKCVRDYLQLSFSSSQYIGARVFLIVKILLKVWSIIIPKEDPNFGEFTSEKN